MVECLKKILPQTKVEVDLSPGSRVLMSDRWTDIVQPNLNDFKRICPNHLWGLRSFLREQIITEISGRLYHHPHIVWNLLTVTPLDTVN